MTRRFSAALLFLSVACFASESSSIAAAQRHLPSVNWKTPSVVSGDFTCRGKTEYALLGTTERDIVVAVFTNGFEKSPKVLRYSAKARDPSSAVLTIEDLDFDKKQFQKDIGYLPRGLVPSKTCKGLNMSDERVDSAHIYWSRNDKRFLDWVL